MPAKLPTMVSNPHTRISGEVLWYYNLGHSQRIGALVYDGATTQKQQEASCADQLSLPTSGFSAAVIVVPNKSVLSVDGMADEFPVKSPLNAAAEAIDTTPSLDIDDYAFDQEPTVAGDQVDVYVLPNPADDVLICYDQGVEPQQGTNIRAIPRKLNPADHYVRQRPENTISLTDLLVSAWSGLQRINGIPVTLIARVYPEGGAVPSQIVYFTNVILTVRGVNSAAEANDSVEATAEGNFNQQLNFSALPA